MRRAKAFLISFLVLLGSHIAIGQSNASFKNISIENGLSQNTVTAIVKDRYGFMWFGTSNGLNRYDGYRFWIYKHDPAVSSSLSHNAISALYVDSQNHLWVGTNGGGLSLYNSDTDSFVVFKNTTDTTSLSNDAVTSICEDKNGNLWVGTYQGINRFDPTTSKFQRFLYAENIASPINTSVSSLAVDKDGNLWVGTYENGIRYFNTKTFSNERYFAIPNESTADGGNFITALLIDRRNRLWIASQSGLARFDNNALVNVIDSSEKTNYYKNQAILSLADAGNGTIWVGFESLGLYSFNPATREYVKGANNAMDEKTDVYKTSPLSLYQDNTGILWIGRDGSGITIADPNENSFGYNSQVKLVNAFVEDRNGTIWIGTDGDGIKRLNPGARNEIFFHGRSGIEVNSSSHVVVSMLCDRDGNIWSGTYGAGLNLYNQRTNTVTHYAKGNRESDLSNDKIYALLEDNNERIWIGTLGGGLNVLERTTGKVKKYRYDGGHSTLPNNDISAIEKGPDNEIWIGTFGSGLNLYNEKEDNFISYQTHNSGLSSNAVSAICVDSKNDIWVGTLDGGLNLFDRKKKRFKVYREADGLISDMISAIEEDHHGNLWISTANGLSKFDPETIGFKNYHKNDGLKVLELRPRASLKTKNNELLFGGLNGFIYFHPDSVKFNKVLPAVVITDFQIFNKPVSLNKSIFSTENIELTSDQSVFTFEFAALNYTSSQKNSYAYKLEGFDKEWNYTSSNRRATYTNLNPGEYVFSVKASNNDGIWNDKGTAIKVILRPPYWSTWWFRTLAIVFLTVTIYSAVRVRFGMIRRQRTKLEHEVRARTNEIVAQKASLMTQAKELQAMNEEQQALNEELKATNEELNIKTNFLQTLTNELEEQKKEILIKREETEKARTEADRANEAKSIFLATMSHEIRTPINGVLGMASLLAETPLTQEQKELTETILTCGDTLVNVINDVLDFSKIESGNLELEDHPFDLRKCIEGVMDMFSPKASEKGIDLLYDISHDISGELVGDSHRLRQILINLISNSLKFTSRGEIYLRIILMDREKDSATLMFELKDTGIGIGQDKLPRLFKAFSQADSSTTRKYGGTGLGLVICQQLIELMGGTINVESQEGIGTQFNFTIKAGIRETHLARANPAMFEADERHILVIDENVNNLAILKRQLEHWKLAVTVTSSAEEGLHALASGIKYHLVITDLQIPQIDGVDLAKKIKQNHQIPIMLLNSVRDGNQKRYGDLFCAIINKPHKQSELYDAIRQTLTSSSSGNTVEPLSSRKILSRDFAQKYPMRILLVEDNPVNQQLAIRTLQKLGYDAIEVAENGSIAVEKTCSQRFQLIFMDVQMPVMDGLEATRIIRSRNEWQPFVIAMTANAMKGDREICLKAGMNDYITKPIKFDDLLTALKNAAESLI